MRLLIWVNKFDKNDDLLGFFVGWVNELAKYLPTIIVVAQTVGEYDGLPNLRVISLDKAKTSNPVLRVFKFWRLLWEIRREYDGIFVIMAPAWTIIAGLLAKLLNKKLYFWYAVWRGNWKLRLAEKFADKVFCSVEEAFPFKTRKLVLLGQGIDTDYFLPDETVRQAGRILFLGRVSPVKKIEIMLEALAKLPDETRGHLKIDIAGAAMGRGGEEYLVGLKKMALDLKLDIGWVGRVPHSGTRPYYQRADIFVNLTPAGSFDKAMLEAMSCGDLVLASNQALARFFAQHQFEKSQTGAGQTPELKEILIFKQNDPVDLADKLRNILNLDPNRKTDIHHQLREIIVNHHSQKQWARKLIASF